MKKLIYSLFAFATLSLAAASCVKEIEEYKPAEVPSGDQVFFHKDVKTDYEISDSTLFYDETTKELTSTFGVLVNRVNKANATTVKIKCTYLDKDGVEIENSPVTGPESINFIAGLDTTRAVFTFDRAVFEPDDVYKVVMEIADEDQASPYGASRVTISVIYPNPLPWIFWDEGTLTESGDFWGEKETGMKMYYQQISDTLRYCKIDDCFGHDTIEKGDEYDVQPYCWYWNTKTNKVYIPLQYMGYSGDGAPTYYGDECAFYNDQWGYYYPAGSPEYFSFCDKFRAAYPDDYYPSYDGNGGFNLSDYYVVGLKEKGTYLGLYMQGGKPDTFVGSSYDRITNYNDSKKFDYKAAAVAVDSSTFWKEKFDFTLMVAEDPDCDETAPSVIAYIPGFVNDTTGLAFILAASDSCLAKAEYSIRDGVNAQYTDYDVFGKKLGFNINGRKSKISGSPEEYPCSIELCIVADLYDVEQDAKGKNVYTKAYSLGEFIEYITLTEEAQTWYTANDLFGGYKEDYIGSYYMISCDLFDDGKQVYWPVTVEDAGKVGTTSYLKFSNFLPYDSTMLPVNEFLIEWYNGFLYLAKKNLEGPFKYKGYSFDVTVQPMYSESEYLDDTSYLLGGFTEDDLYGDIIAFVDYPYNDSPVNGFYAYCDAGGLSANYNIMMMPSTTTTSVSAVKKSFVPAKYDVRTHMQKMEMSKRANHSHLADLSTAVPYRAAERYTPEVIKVRHTNGVDTSNAVKVEKNLKINQLSASFKKRF